MGAENSVQAARDAVIPTSTLKKEPPSTKSRKVDNSGVAESECPLSKNRQDLMVPGKWIKYVMIMLLCCIVFHLKFYFVVIDNVSSRLFIITLVLIVLIDGKKM